MWDSRYNNPSFVFGTEPNDFLRDYAHHLPKGKILSLAEGEGRNAVFLAAQGYDVTGVDSSAVGLEKAQRLAQSRSVRITTITADLAQFKIEPNSWDGVVSIFCHLPSTLRRDVYKRVAAGLKPGGCFLIEAYTPKQLAFKTGGPQNPDSMPDLASLRQELIGLRLEHAAELERDIFEGPGHTGRGHVVQIMAFKEG